MGLAVHDGVPRVGAACSRFIVAVTEALLPALSTAVPVAVWLAPSVDRVTGEAHEVMVTPLVGSVHVKVIATGLLFQPALFGVGDRL